MSTHEVVARFAIAGWEPAEMPGIDGDWIGAAVMRKTYTEGLVGESIAHFVSSGTEEDGRGYLAAERITGTLEDGRSGSLTIHHGALSHPVDPSAFGYIVSGTGTDDFASFTGQAGIDHDSRGPALILTITS